MEKELADAVEVELGVAVDDVAVARRRRQRGLEVEDGERVRRHRLGETMVVVWPAVAGGTAWRGVGGGVAEHGEASGGLEEEEEGRPVAAF